MRVVRSCDKRGSDLHDQARTPIYPIDSDQHRGNPLLDARPRGCGEDHDAKGECVEILLVLKVLVRGDKHLMPRSGGLSEKRTVLQLGPAQFGRCFDKMRPKVHRDLAGPFETPTEMFVLSTRGESSLRDYGAEEKLGRGSAGGLALPPPPVHPW